MKIYKITYDQDGNEAIREELEINVFRQEPITKMMTDRKGSVVQTSARLFIKPDFIFTYSDRVIYKIIYQGVEKDLISIQDNYSLSNVLDHYEIYI